MEYSSVQIRARSYLIPTGQNSAVGKLQFHDLGIDRIVDLTMKDGSVSVAMPQNPTPRIRAILEKIQSGISLDSYVERTVSPGYTPFMTDELGRRAILDNIDEVRDAGRYFFAKHRIDVNPSLWVSTDTTTQRGNQTVRIKRRKKSVWKVSFYKRF